MPAEEISCWALSQLPLATIGAWHCQLLLCHSIPMARGTESMLLTYLHTYLVRILGVVVVGWLTGARPGWGAVVGMAAYP
jgi:hypothetical protein